MKILFIHHSTGGNLIKEGKLREGMGKLNLKVELWDHNYNLVPIFGKFIARITHYGGLSDAAGATTGLDYDIVLSNNSPREYAEIFARDVNDPTLKAILSYDVIAFKNCFPTTKIVTDAQLTEDIRLYNEIAKSLNKYPKKRFILWTPPPMRAEMTTHENAKRAERLVDYLTSKNFKQKVDNIFVFGFFSLLADRKGFLKKEYVRRLSFDSHPNKRANEVIAPIFAKFIKKVSEAG